MAEALGQPVGAVDGESTEVVFACLARHQLGRVVTDLDVPRGPDILHRIRVRAEWLEEGAAIEFELPRNVTCAECEGGGCDRCDRSGAITLRGKKDLGEVVQVTLPKRDESDVERTVSGRALVIRIPQRGGYADDPELPRGMLKLSVVPADEPDPGVVRVEQPLPSLAEEIAASVHPDAILPARGPRRTAAIVVTVLVILWIALLVWLRVTGRG